MLALSIDALVDGVLDFRFAFIAIAHDGEGEIYDPLVSRDR